MVRQPRGTGDTNEDRLKLAIHLAAPRGTSRVVLCERDPAHACSRPIMLSRHGEVYGPCEYALHASSRVHPRPSVENL